MIKQIEQFALIEKHFHPQKNLLEKNGIACLVLQLAYHCVASPQSLGP